MGIDVTIVMPVIKWSFSLAALCELLSKYMLPPSLEMSLIVTQASGAQNQSAVWAQDL